MELGEFEKCVCRVYKNVVENLMDGGGGEGVWCLLGPGKLSFASRSVIKCGPKRLRRFSELRVGCEANCG